MEVVVVVGMLMDGKSFLSLLPRDAPMSDSRTMTNIASSSLILEEDGSFTRFLQKLLPSTSRTYISNNNNMLL